MPAFRVLLRGESFRMLFDGEPQRVGFYTTRFVEASDPEEAENRAVQLLREDEWLRGAVLNERNDPPMLYAEEIEPVSRLEKASGYVFFDDDEPA